MILSGRVKPLAQNANLVKNKSHKFNEFFIWLAKGKLL